MLGMVFGLALGKRLLAQSTACQPRAVYFCSALLATGCIFGASFLPQSSFSYRFWVYALLMGLLNGVFAGVAYQAPMLTCQTYFPDRKQMVGFALLLGSAIGIATYSALTTMWAADCTD